MEAFTKLPYTLSEAERTLKIIIFLFSNRFIFYPIFNYCCKTQQNSATRTSIGKS